MVKPLCHLLMRVNHDIVANFYVANISFNAIRENKILAKIYIIDRGVLYCALTIDCGLNLNMHFDSRYPDFFLMHAY